MGFVFLVAIGANYRGRKIIRSRSTAQQLAKHQQKLTGQPHQGPASQCTCFIIPGYFTDDQGNRLPGSPDEVRIEVTHGDYKTLRERTWYGDEIVTWKYSETALDEASAEPERFLHFVSTQIPGKTTNGSLFRDQTSQTPRRRAPTNRPRLLHFYSF